VRIFSHERQNRDSHRVTELTEIGKERGKTTTAGRRKSVSLLTLLSSVTL
jgi:hypothetical protein